MNRRFERDRPLMPLVHCHRVHNRRSAAICISHFEPHVLRTGIQEGACQNIASAQWPLLTAGAVRPVVLPHVVTWRGSAEFDDLASNVTEAPECLRFRCANAR